MSKNSSCTVRRVSIISRIIVYLLCFTKIFTLTYSLSDAQESALIEEGISPGIRSANERYGFDVRFADTIKYRWLPEDRFDVNFVPIREVLTLIQNHKNEEATIKAEETLSELFQNNSPLDINDGEAGFRDFVFLASYGRGRLFNDFSRLLGLAYEMERRYQAAWEAYGMAYGSNPKALKWTHARLVYENRLYDDAFARVCDILSEEYSFTKENVESVIKKVNTVKESYLSTGILPNSEDAGIPTGRSDIFVRDAEVLEIYRIRNWCVRFINPNVDYSFRGIDRPSSSQEQWDYIAKIQELYAIFEKFMEKEYAKKYSSENSPTILKGRDTQVMEFLRKMLELPY